MLAPDFTFALLWSSQDGAREFAGGLEEWRGYMDQRQPDGQRHHISRSLRDGDVEVVSGWTTRNGDPLGTFTFTAELDGEDRMRRLFAARTESFAGKPF
jgi:hypothetical protein